MAYTPPATPAFDFSYGGYVAPATPDFDFGSAGVIGLLSAAPAAIGSIGQGFGHLQVCVAAEATPNRFSVVPALRVIGAAATIHTVLSNDEIGTFSASAAVIGVIYSVPSVGPVVGVSTIINPFPMPLGLLSLSGILSGERLIAFHDWSAAVPDGAIITWLLDIEGTPDLRLAIKSWQATLRADFSSYVQVVVPAVADNVDEITARLGNDMVITRRATTLDGAVFDQEMARAPATTPRFQRGPGKHTLTLSGYATAFYTPETPDAETTRTLQKIRSISSGDEFRARCDVDWFLRPGQQAVADGDTITVSYINYYANERGAYMDVGGVAA